MESVKYYSMFTELQRLFQKASKISLSPNELTPQSSIQDICKIRIETCLFCKRFQWMIYHMECSLISYNSTNIHYILISYNNEKDTILYTANRWIFLIWQTVMNLRTGISTEENRIRGLKINLVEEVLRRVRGIVRIWVESLGRKIKRGEVGFWRQTCHDRRWKWAK